MRFVDNIDNALRDIAESIELSDTRLEKMKSSYNAILDLLKHDDFFSKFEKLIDIFPQGSARLGTTIKPENNDFDLDLVVHIDVPYNNFKFFDIYNNLYRVLHNDGTYKDIVEKKNRCIRVNYESDNYHMDILPALTYDEKNKDRLAVPDREAHEWTVSNPEGFANWFIKKSKFILMREDFNRSLDLTEFTKSKNNPLKSAIKIIKMYRNQYYIDEKQELKVPSVIITTLSAKSYTGTQNISNIITNFIDYCNSALKNDSIKHFMNPAEQEECYSECWEENPDIYAEFKFFLFELKEKIHELRQTNDNILRESLMKSIVSMENYDSGYRYFSNRLKKNREDKKRF